MLIWSSPYLVAFVLLENLLSLGFVSYYSWKMKVVSLLFQYKSWILFFRSGFLLSLLGFHLFASLTMVASLYFSLTGQWEPRLSDTICTLIVSLASIFVSLFLVTGSMFVVQFIKNTQSIVENKTNSIGLGRFILNDSLQYKMTISITAIIIVYTIVIDIVYLQINNNPRVCWFWMKNFAIYVTGSLGVMLMGYGIIYIRQTQTAVRSNSVLSGSEKNQSVANGMTRLLITLGMGVSTLISMQLFQIIENVLEWEYYFNNQYEDSIYKGFDLQLIHVAGSLGGMMASIIFMKFLDKHIESKSSKASQKQSLHSERSQKSSEKC